MGDGLDGRRVLVFGASGNVGYGAAQAFLAAGAQVIAPTRSPASAEALRAHFDGAIEPVIGDISDPNGAASLADAVAERGPIHHAFVSLGPWWQEGPLVRQTPDEWLRVRRMMLDGHVHAAMLFIPMLASAGGGSYTVVTGMGAHHYVPGTSLLFAAVGGVLSLSKVLRSEHADDDVRVNELLISARVERTARPGVVEAVRLGEFAASIARDEALRGEVLTFDGSAR